MKVFFISWTTQKCMRDLPKSLDYTLRITGIDLLQLLQNKGTYILEEWIQKNCYEEQERT